MRHKVHIKYNMFWRSLFFVVAVLYLELFFHVAVYGRVDVNLIHICSFGAAVGMTVAMLTMLLPKIGNAVMSYLFTGIFCIYYITQLIYFRIFGTFLSLVSVGGAENAMNFKVVLFDKMRENAGWIAAMLLPLVTLVILHITCISFPQPGFKRTLIGGGVCAVLWILAIMILPIQGKTMYSPYDLFHGNYVLELSMEKLGVAVTTVRDGTAMAGGNKKNVSFEFNGDTAEETMHGVVERAPGSAYAVISDSAGGYEVSYCEQIDETIQLKQLYDSAENEELRNITAYISGLEPTMENAYTGLFEDYNVVFVTAESLSRYGISDTCTPTLYKIMNQGFVFDNFYNPRWYHSTIDGEYVNCLGQYPCSSDWSFYKSAETYQPYALGNALKPRGYTCKAYHDFTFYYYNRSETHANMGYDFKAIDYGLEIPYYSPYSDLDTMEAVYDEFINEDPFVTYFMSFSGHLPYNYSYNAMSLKNREEAEKLTEGMNLPEEAVAYIASQMELDKALEFLMEKLDEAGTLDHTLFVVTPDHYPYGLDSDVYDAMAGADISTDHFELHRSCLGIWSTAMEDGELRLRDGSVVEGPVKVEKLCASVDILPTLLNMLGVNYDSRLLAGHDIMSDSEELVIFADHSFMTDKVRYNTSTGEVHYLVDEKYVPNGYIDSMIEKVENILYISDEIINTDYFSFVYGVIGASH